MEKPLPPLGMFLWRGTAAWLRHAEPISAPDLAIYYFEAPGARRIAEPAALPRVTHIASGRRPSGRQAVARRADNFAR